MDDYIYSGIYKKGPSKKTNQFIMDPTMTQMESKLIIFYLWETIAHNLMLAKQKIVPKQIAMTILENLLILISHAKKNEVKLDPELGDLHENIEHQLVKMMGPDAGWFHVGRSRNDQTVTDQKLFMKKYCLDILEMMKELEIVFLHKSEQYKNIIMPGYTHLRSAMPSSFGFWWQAYLDETLEIQEILESALDVMDSSPLGAGASYGVNWKINPKFTASKLGFKRQFNNALSSVNSRGIHESLVIGILCTFMVILSRMMEDLIIWSLPELHYVAISEEFTTGSSIMPQKMNPDIAEKIRSKTAKLIGNLTYVLTSLKATPSGYNRDSAESKIAIIDSLEEVLRTISIATEMLGKIIPDEKAMKKAVISSLPTKLTDMIVAKYKFPFRTAHKIVGKAVFLAKGDIAKITTKILETAIFQITTEKVRLPKEFLKKIFSVDKALDHYQYPGSPATVFVSRMNDMLHKKINTLSQWTYDKTKQFEHTQSQLIEEVKKFINA